MCYQITELYSSCRCLYYQHAVDRCQSWGRPGHHIAKRTILVGSKCQNHSSPSHYRSDDDSFATNYGIYDSSISQDEQESNFGLSQGYGGTNRYRTDPMGLSEAYSPNAHQLRANQLQQSRPRHTVERHNDTIRVAENVRELNSPTVSNPIGDLPIVGKKQHGTTALDMSNVPITVPALKEVETTRASPQEIVSSGHDLTFDDNLALTFNDLKIPGEDKSSTLAYATQRDAQPSSDASNQLSQPHHAINVLRKRLVEDSQLKHLWPRLLRRSASIKALHEEVACLLLRYSLDLQDLTKSLTKEGSHDHKTGAANIIEIRRYYVARELCLNIYETDRRFDSRIDKASGLKQEQDLGIAKGPGNQKLTETNPIESLEDFLFMTGPFDSLKATVRQLVEQPFHVPPLIRMVGAGRQWFDSVCSLTTLKDPKPPFSRLHYSCRCGHQLYDDYTESRTGALGELKLLLEQNGFGVSSPGDLESNNPRVAISSSARKIDNPQTPPQSLNFRLPFWGQKQAGLDLGKCQRSTEESQNEEKHSFVLACIPFGRLIYKLHQPEVCTIKSDQDFFSLLRTTYHHGRTRTFLSFIRKVKSVNFVHLEVFRTNFADIRNHLALPPGEMSQHYNYDPMPADLMPPIGSNLLVHLMENPTHAGCLPDLYKRIPKKLQDPLSPCLQKGSSLGWGLGFVEGVDTFIFFLCGCVGFLICLFVALTWTIAKSDVQGGFGLGAFLLSFMMFCGGLVHSYLTT